MAKIIFLRFYLAGMYKMKKENKQQNKKQIKTKQNINYCNLLKHLLKTY